MSVAGESALPLEVERFVVECIPSVAHLEALLLLRSRAGEELPLETIATLLYVEPERAMDGDRDAIDALAEAYRTMLIPLTRFIHEVAEHRSIRDFADAFRFRKE